MNVFQKIGLALKLKSSWSRIEQLYNEGEPVMPALRLIWHLIAVNAPALVGAAIPVLTGSHNPYLIALGSAIGALLPLFTKRPQDTLGKPTDTGQDGDAGK